MSAPWRIFPRKFSRNVSLLLRQKPFSHLLKESERTIFVAVLQNDCQKSTQLQKCLPYATKYTQTRFLHLSQRRNDDIRVVTTPPFADSISEGDIRWSKEVGDVVAEDEIVGEIETDKTSMPVPAPAAGIIEELLVEDGAKVEKGAELFRLKVTGDAPPPKPASEKSEPAAAPPPPSPPKPDSAAGAIPTSPPPAPPMPSAPMQVKDTSQVKVTPVAAEAPAAGSRGETRIKMNRMRLRIAQRLKDAQNTCAMLTTFNEIDMTNIMELRTTYKEAFQKKHGIKFGFMSAFLKASAYALQDQPAVNAVIDGGEIVYRDYVDISVAVATPKVAEAAAKTIDMTEYFLKGLVVPVLRNVEGMNYVQIEQGLVDLGEKARAGALAVEDMDGGTFTVSNGGVFGSLMGTPIINPPQSAILGMHGIFDRPIAVKKQVEVRPMMYVALTYDHRLVDGREAVTFLRKVKSAVEDPRVMFMDL